MYIGVLYLYGTSYESEVYDSKPPNIIERYPRAKSLQYKVTPTVHLPLDLIFSDVATLHVQIKYVVHSPIVYKVLLRLCVLRPL